MQKLTVSLFGSTERMCEGSAAMLPAFESLLGHCWPGHQDELFTAGPISSSAEQEK